MKNTALALTVAALLSSGAAFAQDGASTETVETTAAPATAGAPAKRVLELPAQKHRRRMLVDFGLFGCGVHVGWMKPKSYINPDVTDKHIGKPIFNVTAGTHGLGVGRN